MGSAIWIALVPMDYPMLRAAILRQNSSFMDCFVLYERFTFSFLGSTTSLWRWMPSTSRVWLTTQISGPMWPSTNGSQAFYCSVFISFIFLLPIILEQTDYHIVCHQMRIFLKRMTLKTGWIILIHSWLLCWTIVSLPMGDWLTSLDTHQVHYRMAVLCNLCHMKMPCLLTWIHPVLPPFSSLPTWIHTMTTWPSHALWKLVLKMIGLTEFVTFLWSHLSSWSLGLGLHVLHQCGHSLFPSEQVTVPSRAAWVTSASCSSWVLLWTHSGGTW